MVGAESDEHGALERVVRRAEELPDFLTIDELAGYLAMKRSGIYSWRNDGVGPASTSFGRLVRYRKQDVLDWVERVRQTGEV